MPTISKIKDKTNDIIYDIEDSEAREDISDLKSEIALNSGVPTAVKNAIDTLFQNVAFKNVDVYTDEIAVVHNWATAVNLLSISAVFNQGTNVIYDTDSLDSLKQYLTVTALYDNGTSEVLSDSAYTLSGTLTVGTSTITVTYGGKTTTFNVIVSELLTLQMAIGSIDASTGADQTLTTRIRSVGYIEASETISVSGCPFANTWYDYAYNDYDQCISGYAFRCYDSSKQLIGSLTNDGVMFMEDISNVNLPSGTAYVRLIVNGGNGTGNKHTAAQAVYTTGWSNGVINPIYINSIPYMLTE